MRIFRGRSAIEKPDHRHRRLLRARRERPRGCRAAERDYQFPPSDDDCHTPLPCEVRKWEGYHATSVLSLTARRSTRVGRAVGRVLINAEIVSALGVNRTCRDGRNDVNDPKQALSCDDNVYVRRLIVGPLREKRT